MLFHYDTSGDALTFETQSGPMLVNGEAACPTMIKLIRAIADARGGADQRAAIPLIVRGAHAGIMRVRFDRGDQGVIVGQLVEPTDEALQPVHAYAREQRIPDLSPDDLAEASAVRDQILALLAAPEVEGVPAPRSRGRPSTGKAMTASERTAVRRRRLAKECLRLVQVPVPAEAGRGASRGLAAIAILLYRHPESPATKQILGALNA